ncbi:SWIM zinc finger domain-containing protein [Methylomicrobium lacus]|uniref:SWIM zinc finger family protein n=1 Tax=Methylomicrobium lacus TaxID=136992 RepID=UPI0035A99B12
MFNKLITPNILKNLAGAAVFARGGMYYENGQVGPLRETGRKISARVEGSEIYHVELRDDGDYLAHDCSCPNAVDGFFCKHCVAVGLAWLAEHEDGSGQRPDPWRTIRDYLEVQSPDLLIAWLMDAAEQDDRLYRTLLLKAESVAGGAHAAKVYRAAIERATQIRGFLDWGETGAFAEELDQVVDAIAALSTPEDAPLLMELAEYAIVRVAKALENLDDSNGEVGGVLNRLSDLHLEACRLAKPDPQALAERLFRMEMSPANDYGDINAIAYRDLLGEAGLRRYRELAEAEWAKIGFRDGDSPYDFQRYRITRIMEFLAEASGNVEELVAIKARDLSTAYRYLTIAGIWAANGRDDKALEWAERGLHAFPIATDNRLRDFLVAAYLKSQRNEEALQLTWVQFEERPILDHYKKLHAVADRLGVWPEQRQRALAKLADAIAGGAAAVSYWKTQPGTPDYSVRLHIALWENNLDDAWAAAHAGVRDRNLLIELAGRLETERPDDALALYRQIIPTLVEQTNNAAYAEAIKLVRRTESILNGPERKREFMDYLAELRSRFKPKRNFIKLLDEVSRRPL